MQTHRTKIIFKDYNINQNLLLPPSLEELITSNHPVRIVNHVVDNINIEPLIKRYKGGGTSSYHPRMLLKVLVYGYLCNYYSSRKLEDALLSNIHFMWLSGMSRPDHNTINRFRSDRLKGVLKQVFSQVVELLIDSGQISLKEVYLDGTRIEANANRYTFVWGNSIKTSKERIKTQLEELWSYTEQVAKEELEQHNPRDFRQINAEKVQQAIERIDRALSDKPISKKVRQKLNYAKKTWPKNLKKYEHQERLLQHRKSFSKTDVDATFMRMKEDHMKNGQLKLGYNWQVSSHNQFIVNYTIHQTSNDITTLKPHLESYKRDIGRLPENIVADAGYGSLENYEYLEQEQVGAYVKYNYYYQEQQAKNKENPFRTENLYYNEQQDCYYCPMGQKMDRVRTRERITDNGYVHVNHIYRARKCQGCPLRGPCFKTKGNRQIEINHTLNKYRKKVRDNLLSPKGEEYRRKRASEIEAVFGMIKSNRNFRRFMLRGLEKVEIEAGLLALAHNLKKMVA
jgi:transposase